MTIKITILLTAFFVISCSDKKKETSEKANLKTEAYTNLDNAKWLLGTWRDDSGKGVLSEIWKTESDSSYAGASFMIVGKDTTFSETVRLSERNGKLVYTVTAKGQNDEKPVAFTSTSTSGNKLVFENAKHDYPTKITYENKGDSLKARISGLKAGAEVIEDFAMKRVQ